MSKQHEDESSSTIDVDAVFKLSMTQLANSVESRSVTPPDEIEIPLELVGSDERLPKGVLQEDGARPPRHGRRLTVTSSSETPLSPLDEEELTTSSSSSSSTQSSSPADDDDWTAACCADDHLTDRASTLRNSEMTGSDALPVGDLQLPTDASDAEVLAGSATVSVLPSESSIIGSRIQHHGTSGLTARIGNLLNNAVMKAHKQLSRGQWHHTCCFM